MQHYETHKSWRVVGMQQVLHYKTRTVRDIDHHSTLTNAVVSCVGNRRRFDPVHLRMFFVVRRGFRRGVGRPLQLVDGVLVVNGFARNSSSPQPRVVQRLRRRHPLGRVPLEATREKLDEERILAAAECLGEVAGRRRAAVLSTSGTSPGQLVASARTRRQRTVPGESPRADEMPRSLADVE